MRKLVPCLAFIALLLAPAPTASSESRTADGATVTRQTLEEALAEDLALVAKARGWTIDEATADYKAAESVGRVAERIAAERPDLFVGSVLSSEPGAAPVLYIKGSADQFIRSLVADADVEITIVDKQPFSFDELEERKLQVHHALEAQGFRTVSTGVNITGGGVIRAGVTRQLGLSADVDDILARLPSGVRASVMLTVNERPIVVDEHAFGGQLVLETGRGKCTSGWSVVHTGTNRTGVTTAGHCDRINQFAEPGVVVDDLEFRSQHRGQWGDIEWHFSPGHINPPQFFSDARDIRDVAAVEARGNISVGESVCLYGRFSDVRNCALDVQDVSQACTNDGVFNDRLVLMNGDVGIPGDSGGGWSFGATAFGSHKGNCADVPGREVFSVADLYDEAIGVRVRVLN